MSIARKQRREQERKNKTLVNSFKASLESINKYYSFFVGFSTEDLEYLMKSKRNSKNAKAAVQLIINKRKEDADRTNKSDNQDVIIPEAQ